MSYPISASISSSAAAKLVITGDISLDTQWPDLQADTVLFELCKLSADDLLFLADQSSYCEIADIRGVPQFGKIETLFNVPSCFSELGISSVDYVQLGLFLKKDVTSSLNANRKFGENHGKAASFLGIVNCINSRFIPSSLTFAFCALDQKMQNEVIKRLLFRLPIIQILLRAAKDLEISGYAPMALLKESTKKRRGQSVRAILSFINTLNNPALSSRINNIVWKTE